MMTTTGAANVHALAVEGTFDDCQAVVKGLFNHHAFRDAVSLVGRQLDQLGAGRGAGGLLLHLRGRARCAGAGGGLHGADRQFRRHLSPAMVAKRMGLPIRLLRIAANVNDILPLTLKNGIYEVARGVCDGVALDGHPGVVEFRAAVCSRRGGVTRAACAG